MKSIRFFQVPFDLISPALTREYFVSIGPMIPKIILVAVTVASTAALI
ncbi:hypothetical protein KAH55_14175 [bacterium]|nr:hypothetical protein [bacterium]